MAKIPDVNRLDRSIPTGRAAIATLDIPDAGLVAREGSKLLHNLAERRTKNQLAKADVDMATALVAETNAYDDDPDYSTITERFTGNTKKRLGEIASTIDNGEARNAFVQSYREKLAVQTERMNVVARGKEREFERGELIERSDKLINSGIVSGDVQGTYDRYSELVDSSVDLGWMDADEAAKSRLEFKHRLAKGRIERLEPEKRVEALKQPWAKNNLPADDYSTLLRKAEADTLKGKAQGIVDEFMAEDKPREEILAKIDKKYSLKPDLREEVERRYDYAMAEQRKDVVEARSDLNDKYMNDILKGERVDDLISEADQEAAGGDLMRQFRAAEANTIRGRKVPFSITHQDRMYQLKIASDKGVPGAAVKMREYFLAHVAEMNATQQKAWSEVTIDGLVPPDVESGLTDIQVISSRLPDSSDAEKRRVMLGEMGEWRKKYIDQFGKVPTDDDRDKYIDRQLMEYGVGRWWRTDTPVREMNVEQKKQVLTDMAEDNPDAYQRAAQYFVDQNIMPSPAELMEKINEVKNAPVPLSTDDMPEIVP